MHACKALAKTNVRITLIDKRNINPFQPLLYQVATGLVSRSDVATPLREEVGKQHNVQVLDAEDAHLPIASGKGPSIAKPDAALKAAMDYYAHQLSGLPLSLIHI